MELLEIEKSIIKKFRKPIWSKFIKAVIEYKLIEKGDNIAVCVSGGKDSLLMAKLFQELMAHGPVRFTCHFIAMDPGFSEENLINLKLNCEKLNIPLIIKESNVFLVAEELDRDNPCYMCARMRRGFLYNAAKELNCNKMALGHHFNDVIETTLLNLFYAGCFKTMLPKFPSDNFDDLLLIRPLFLIREEDIIKFSQYSLIKAMNCGCKVTKREEGSKRKMIKQLINELKIDFDDVEKSIFRASGNINLEAVLGYQDYGKNATFNEIFEKRMIRKKNQSVKKINRDFENE